ncbi:MAG: AI-2E family transporter, partial [Acidobacteria bacterium]|nr:AI-2E family transporter [Acidobacteriota bacterium]
MADRKINRADMKEVAETAAGSAAATATAATTTATWAQTRAILRLIGVIFAVVTIAWGLYKLQSVLVLLVLSIFFAYLIAPLVEFVRRPFKLGHRERLMPRPLAIGIVYLVIFGSIGLVVFLLLPQVGDQFYALGQQAPGYYKGISERVQSLSRLYQRLPQPLREPVRSGVGQTVEAIGG